MKKFFALMFAALLMLSSTSFAETIQATGYGYGPKGATPKSSFYKTYARQAARLEALRILAEIIYGVNLVCIETDDIVKGYISSKDLKNFRQVGEVKFDEDGLCEVKMEMEI